MSDSEASSVAPARLAAGIGVLTAVSGAGLVTAPRLVLRVLGAGRRDPAPFFVQVVGMFMTVSGGLTADGCRHHPPSGIAVRWALASKLGATTAMVLGVRSGRLGRLALGVAAFDGISAALLLKLLVDERR